MSIFVAAAISAAGARPRYLLTDKGTQFVAEVFRRFAKRRRITLRYAAADSLRATAIIERFFRSLKTEWLRRIAIPLAERPMRRAIERYLGWYHAVRPHQGLGGSNARRGLSRASARQPSAADRAETELAAKSALRRTAREGARGAGQKIELEG